MNLVVDIGNTKAKMALFDRNTIVDHKTIEKFSKVDLSMFLEGKQVQNILLSSVVGHNQQWEVALKTLGRLVRLNAELALPISLDYDTPSTLGNDRLANAVALYRQYPNVPALSVDLGTCIKYDIVDGKGTYLGGAISPGYGMRLKSMNTFTAHLPLIEKKSFEGLVGKSTVTSMKSGAFNGIQEEINGMIKRFRSEFPDLVVVITGGDAHFFDMASKNAIFADVFLTLKGLNEILLHHTKVA